ncbi:MAG: apolipoprotein N-acyltransferase [Spirochaetaceae bacterium]|nr:apolipoprotein N-acyltransferase [Spirochaetaceae bacterium]
MADLTRSANLGGAAGRSTGKTSRQVVAEVAALTLSAALFALSFPNPLSTWGWYPLAFVALAPLFWVIGKAPWSRVVLYGILYGFGSYALFNYWLATFHALALLFVPTIHLLYMGVLFPALKLVTDRFPRHAPLWQAVLWVAYEYLKTQGFLGYSYGVIGYTQYLFGPLVRSAAFAGVWGVSLLVVLANSCVAYLVEELRPRGDLWRRFGRLLRARPLVPAVCTLLFAGAVVYGAALPADYGDSPLWRVALVQQNIDPWRGGYLAYERSLHVLLRQSRRALAEDPDVVIWSETSFVPGIDWHSRYRGRDRPGERVQAESIRKYELVRQLRAFLDEQTVPFVVGNDDGQRVISPETGDPVRIDYNAALLYEGGQIVQTYRKLHLVPFTEHYPDWGPRFLRDLLEDFDTHFWEQGDEWTVFDAGGVRFSTPICFEDTFGYLNREFVNRGAQVIVNMTNDTWSGSVPAEMQHFAMAVFRATENRRSVVRAANSGITAIVEPSGRITATLEPFVEATLIGEVPVFDAATTPYSRAGDWLGVALTAAALLLIAGALGGAVLRRWRDAR